MSWLRFLARARAAPRPAVSIGRRRRQLWGLFGASRSKALAEGPRVPCLEDNGRGRLPFVIELQRGGLGRAPCVLDTLYLPCGIVLSACAADRPLIWSKPWAAERSFNIDKFDYLKQAQENKVVIVGGVAEAGLSPITTHTTLHAGKGLEFEVEIFQLDGAGPYKNSSSLSPIRDTLLASAQCQNSASRMMTGSGTPKSQRRMPLPMIRSLYRAGREDAVVPRTVAQHAALGCRQARGEGAE